MYKNKTMWHIIKWGREIMKKEQMNKIYIKKKKTFQYKINIKYND